jgi:hypothetical protein
MLFKQMHTFSPPKNTLAYYNAGVVFENSATDLAPGFDDMIIIFCDFCQFLAKKLAFSQKPML